MLEPNHRRISLRRQCALLGLNRSTAYYGAEPESAMNLQLKEIMDVQYTARPFYGVPPDHAEVSPSSKSSPNTDLGSNATLTEPSFGYGWLFSSR